MVTQAAPKPANRRAFKPCPHCGKPFQALQFHEGRCPANPAPVPAPRRNAPARGAPVLTPAHSASAPSSEAVLIARHENDRVTTKEDVHQLLGVASESGNQPMTVLHTVAGKIALYKPVKTGKGVVTGWRRVNVVAGNLAIAFANGFRETCGYCGGYCGNEPNDCPAQPKRRYRICPVCLVKVYDPLEAYREGMAPEEVADPLEIRDEQVMTTTPEQRTLVAWQTHMRAWHPQQALEYGIQPLPMNAMRPTAQPILGGVA